MRGSSTLVKNELGHIVFMKSQKITMNTNPQVGNKTLMSGITAEIYAFFLCDNKNKINFSTGEVEF